MEILDTNRTISKSLWRSRRWSEWETGRHECGAHEKNELMAKLTHEMHLYQPGTDPLNGTQRCWHCQGWQDVRKRDGGQGFDLFCNRIDGGLCHKMNTSLYPHGAQPQKVQASIKRNIFQ